MEHISEILKKNSINTSRENTDTWSAASKRNAQGNPECPVCKGFGFVYDNVPLGHPNYGKAVPCRCLKDKANRQREGSLLKYSNLGILAKITFEGLEAEGYGADAEKAATYRDALDEARRWTLDPSGWLILTGQSGSGKTRLAAAIASESIKNGRTAMYVTVPDLLEKIRVGFTQDAEAPADNYFERVKNVPLLVIDDLGVQSSTAWAKEKLDQLINYRFSSEMPTVIVTANPIEEFDDRIRTRLSDARFCRVISLGRKLVSSEYEWGTEFRLQREMTFERFDWRRVNLPEDQRVSLKAVFEEARRFAENPDGWLVISGVNGCGKTHLAAAIANYQYGRKKPALFIVVPDFLDHLRSTFMPESAVRYDELFESVRKTPLLILDDFGEQAGTPWAQEKLYQVINYRYNSRLPLVVTTSKTPDEIDNRFVSRFIDPRISVFFQIAVPDYRSSRKLADKKPPATRKASYDR